VKLYVDTADIGEIEEAVRWGVLGGCTTNPTLLARAGHTDPEAAVRKICALVRGPVSVEVIATDTDGMVAEGRTYVSWAENVVVKCPCTPAGLAATAILAAERVAVNMTLVFSPAQAILAAEAGAALVSPFLGRLDDVGADGMALLRGICEIYRTQGYTTQVLAASLRHPMHVVEAARAGAHIATMPFAVFRQLVHHPLTDLGLERFLADWRALHGDAGTPGAQARDPR
jgi:transaldolase